MRRVATFMIPEIGRLDRLSLALAEIYRYWLAILVRVETGLPKRDVGVTIQVENHVVRWHADDRRAVAGMTLFLDVVDGKPSFYAVDAKGTRTEVLRGDVQFAMGTVQGGKPNG